MKYLLLNTQNVIIDIVDNPRYIKKNETTGRKYSCNQIEAAGIMGSDGDTIYNMASTTFNVQFYDIGQVSAVSMVPEDVKPMTHVWTQSEGFTKFSGMAPATNLELTKQQSELITTMAEIIGGE